MAATAIMPRLDEITKTLQELKAENKSLREIVEETQIKMKAIQNKTLDKEMTKEITELLRGMKLNEADEGCEKEKSPEEFPVVEIQRRTIQEERSWMKEKFNELRKTKKVKDGKSLVGTTVDHISSSIPFSRNIKASCTLKISNFLDSALTDPQYHFWMGSRNGGPWRVGGHQSEVMTFVGNWSRCMYLCSFEISRTLRLTIYCFSNFNGVIGFGIGFSPADVATDPNLYNRLHEMPEGPSVWFNNKLNFIPVELFVSHGSFLVRGHMTAKARTIVHVEVLEMNIRNLSTHPGNEIKRIIVDGKNIKSQASSQNSAGAVSRVPRIYGRFSCVIEIVNCLNVTLRSLDNFYCKCQKNDFMIPEVLPFQRETFFGADEMNVQTMFSYGIDSTDFAIVIALKVGPSLNSFAAKLIPLPSVNGEKELEALMDPKRWKSHYRKYAMASEGVQLIQMWNIRIEIRLTEEEQSRLNIRVFAI